MLKSLENLKNGLEITLKPDEAAKEICREVSDEIQREVDEKYILRDEVNKHYCHNPLFDDGETVQVGDYVDLQCEGKRRVRVTGIEPWIVYGDSTSHQKEPYKRPHDPDTQEKIDADLMLDPFEYCAKRGLDFRLYTGPVAGWPTIAMRKDLLARQRKLDGVE